MEKNFGNMNLLNCDIYNDIYDDICDNIYEDVYDDIPYTLQYNINQILLVTYYHEPAGGNWGVY